MDSADDGRYSSLVLTVAALAVLIAGGWWWVASAPTAPPVAPAAAPATVPSPDDAPAVRTFVLVDPSTGAATWMHPDGAAEPRLGAELTEPSRPVDDVLPKFPNTVWRESALLTQDTVRSWPVPARRGERFRLHYACVGPGELSLRVQGALGPVEVLTSCDEAAASVEVVASGDLLISAKHLGVVPVEVGVRLVALLPD